MKRSGTDALRESRAILAAPDVRRLFAARSVSVLGDQMVPIALAFAILDVTGSPTALGAVLAARAVPTVLLLLVGGAVADRRSRRGVMIVTNAVAVTSQLATGVLLLLGVGHLGWLVSLVAVRGATSAFFNPAMSGAIGSSALPGLRQQTFALFSLVGTISEVGGPAVAGVLLLVVEPGWIVVADALTFAVSALFIARCGPLGETVSDGANLWAGMKDGVRYVARMRWLAAVILSATVFQLTVLPALSVLGPVVADESLGGAQAWALVLVGLGLGGIAGSWLSLHWQPHRPLLVAFGIVLFGAGPTLLLLAGPAPLAVVVLSEFVAGAVITFFSTLESSTIATHVPQSMLSRVDAINRFGSMALRPLGLAIMAPVAALIGTSTTLVCAALIAMVALSFPLMIAEVRRLPSDAQSEAEINGARTG